jgi:hypothetical protein
MKIGKVPKNTQEEIRVTMQTYEGTDLIDLRTYWQNKEGNWIPTKKGISLTYYVIEDVIKLLQKAFKKMQEQAEVTGEESPSTKEILEMIKRL